MLSTTFKNLVHRDSSIWHIAITAAVFVAESR
jgi:hypothetical protein